MDCKQLELSDIHKSIRCTINLIREQLKSIQVLVGDATEIKNFTEKILTPLCKRTKQYKLSSFESLKVLQTLVNTSAVETDTDSNRKTYEDAKEHKLDKTLYFPSVPNGHNALKGHLILPSRVRYPAIDPLLTQNFYRRSRIPKFLKPTPPSRRNQLKPSTFNNGNKDEDFIQKLEKLTVYLERLEQATCKFQKIFSLFSQKVLVPLRTFCKPSSIRLTRKIQDDDNTTRSDKEELCNPHQTISHQRELVIVHTMNLIKQLLWASDDVCFEQIFSTNGLSEKVANAINSQRFPVVRVLPDAFQKFNIVVETAERWLDQDETQTENARNGLHRAQRRYTKTEKMWKDARQTERHLRSDFDLMSFEVDTNILRSEKLQIDIKVLQEDLQKWEDQRRTAETKLKDNDENPDRFRVQLKAHQKKINLLRKKIDGKKRNFKILESHLHSYKANRNALEEKILTSKELSESLQATMIKLFHQREAWKRKYFEKTDPKILKTKLEAVGLRIPLPTVREKTFILKTRMQNLMQATAIISDRITSSCIPWSVLCYHLSWPNHFLVTLQNIDKKTKRKPSSDGGSYSGSQESLVSDKAPEVLFFNDEKGNMSSPVDEVVDYVKKNVKSSEKDRCLFMLKLWLYCSGRQASLEHLINALHLSRMEETALCVQRLNSQ